MRSRLLRLALALIGLLLVLAPVQAQGIPAGELDFEWTAARVLRDDPAKTLDTTGRTDVLLLSSLLDTIGRPERSFDLVGKGPVSASRATNFDRHSI